MLHSLPSKTERLSGLTSYACALCHLGSCGCAEEEDRGSGSNSQCAMTEPFQGKVGYFHTSVIRGLFVGLFVSTSRVSES